MKDQEIKKSIEKLAEKLSEKIYKNSHKEAHKLNCDEGDIGQYFEKIMMQTILHSIGHVFYIHNNDTEKELSDLKNRIIGYFSHNMDCMIKTLLESKK